MEGKTLTSTYQSGDLTIETRYTLRGHFAEKELTLGYAHKYSLKNIVVSRPTFSCPNLSIIEHRYPQHGLFPRKPAEKPDCTFFGRTSKGGFFTGLEIPFDDSSVKGNKVMLAFAPSLKMAAGEKLTCEPAYFGVYRRGPNDGNEPKAELPLRSESDAMVAMTSAILGPPRFGLVPYGLRLALGDGTRCLHGKSVEGDMKSLDFLKQCGIDWIGDSHPWGGESAK